MNLLKALQNTQTQRATQPIPGQSANLRQLLAAKSGKAGATTGPAISSIQEQQAASDFEQAATTQQKAAQLDVAGQQQAQQAQVQQQAQAQQQLVGKRQGMQQQFDQAVTKIDNDLQRLQNDLDSKEGRQALANAIAARRLSDEKYITELQRQGKLRRLDNANDFALEAAKSAFGNWKELFANESEFAKMIDMDEAEFQKGLARMNASAARDVLNSQLSAANRSSQYEALGNFGTAGVQAIVDMNKTTPQPTPTQPSTGVNDGMTGSVNGVDNSYFTLGGA